jgi:uncharacterized protein YggU (UPF0235/DUF167 family)
MAYSISAASTVSESAGTLVFTITRSGSFPAETVYASTVQGSANGYAVNSGDYSGLLNRAVTFASGQTSQAVTVSIGNDTLAESNEIFGFIVQRNTRDGLTTFLAKRDWTIIDNDAVAAPSYSISAVRTVDESAGTIAFTITRSGSFPAESIYASTVQGSANGYEINSGDYTGLLNQVVTFTSGQTSRTVTVSIANDTAVEANETFGLIVQRNTTDALTTYLAKRDWTIEDNDAVAAPTYSISAAGSVDEGAGGITFTITRAGNFPVETIYLSTVQGSANGYATNNGDYAGLLNQAVTFTSGQTSRTVTVSIINDTTAEPNESFGLIVQRNTADALTTYLARRDWTIIDNDVAAAPTYSVRAASTVDEGAGTITFTLTRAGSFPAETVYASTVHGAANGYTANSSDYTGLSNQAVTFASGENSRSITVSINNDSVAETNESFGLIVQRNPTDVLTTFLAKRDWTIVDNDVGSANARPNVNGEGVVSLRSGELANASDFLSVTDPNGLNDIAYVRFWDSSRGSDGGYLTLDGGRISGSFVDVAASQLARVAYLGGNTKGENGIVVEAIDRGGLSSGDFNVEFRVSTAAVQAGPPFVVANGTSVVAAGSVTALSQIIRVSDPDGLSDVRELRITDPGGKSGGFFYSNGTPIGSNSGWISFSNFNSIDYRSSTLGDDPISLSVRDASGNVSSLDLTVRSQVSKLLSGTDRVGLYNVTSQVATYLNPAEIERLSSGALGFANNYYDALASVGGVVLERNNVDYKLFALSEFQIKSTVQKAASISNALAGLEAVNSYGKAAINIVNGKDVSSEIYSASRSQLISLVSGSVGVASASAVAGTIGIAATAPISAVVVGGVVIAVGSALVLDRYFPETAQGLIDVVTGAPRNFWDLLTNASSGAQSQALSAVPFSLSQDLAFEASAGSAFTSPIDAAWSIDLDTGDYVSLEDTDPNTWSLARRRFGIDGEMPEAGLDLIGNSDAANFPDVLIGAITNDRIFGLAGNDTLSGQSGDDLLEGGAGNDLIDGGTGLDFAVFTQTLSQAAIVRTLATSMTVAVPDGTDRLTNIEMLSFADGVVQLSDGLPLVDDLFYAQRYADVLRAGVDPDAHYASDGWREGRDPNALFSTASYLAANADVKAAKINPLAHYSAFGWAEGRDASAQFDTALYLARNPDVAAAKIDPLKHYLEYGQFEGRSAYAAIGSKIQPDGFDREYYLLTNQDVAAAGIDPYQHFMTYGWKEGRNPNAWFDVKGYLAAYRDVAAARINPLEHYHQYGWKEGRDPSVKFDTSDYLRAFGDVAAARIDPLVHYLQYGAYEGRNTFADSAIG